MEIQEYRLSNEEASRQTKMSIQSALIRLIEEKDFDSITITEITKSAGVSRPAFYRNFDSKEAVIENACSSVFEMMKDSFKKSSDDLKDWYVTAFNIVKDNSRFISAALSAGLPIAPKDFLDDVFPPESLEEHYLNAAKEAAFTRIVTDWLHDGMKGDPEYMGDLCLRLISPMDKALEE